MDDILSSLSTYGYFILFFYSFGGGFIAITAAGVLSSMGKMDLELSIFIAFVANSLGDAMLFYLARYKRAWFKNNFPEWSVFAKKYRRQIALAHLWTRKYGDWIVFIQKFIYGIKSIIPIVMGTSKYNMVKFNTLSVISAFIWALVFGYSGFYGAGYLIDIVYYVADHTIVMPIALGVISIIVWFIFTKATAKKKK